jgi:hypothetical protein
MAQGGTVSTYLNAETLEKLDGYVARNSNVDNKVTRSNFISMCIRQGLAFALEQEGSSNLKEAANVTDPIYR